MASYPQFGLNFPLLNNPQMMGSGNGSNCMQAGTHTANCDVAHARPVATDPQTGQTICICQYDRIVNTYRQYMHFSNPSSFSPANSNNNLDHPSVNVGGGHAGHAGAFSPASLPSNAGNLSGHPVDPIQAMYATHGPMRDPAGVFAEFKDISSEASAAAWRAAAVGMGMGMASQNAPLTTPGCYGGYDPSLAAAGVYSSNPYCTNGYGMDPSGMNRRKNATRETTSQLKHWLYEHRKNPYPTKGEKIMLAIVTKMTLTQVSTWFANARRRLKKENKMTWSPRNRGCEDDDKSDTEQIAGQDQDLDLEKNDDDDEDSLSEMSSLTDENKRHTSVSPLATDCKDASDLQSLQPTSQDCNVNKTSSTTMTKPRIWSLADVAMDRTPPANVHVEAAIPTGLSQIRRLNHPPATTHLPSSTSHQHGGLRGVGVPPGGINFFPQYAMHAQPPTCPAVTVNLFTSNPNSAFSSVPITPSTNRFSTMLHAHHSSHPNATQLAFLSPRPLASTTFTGQIVPMLDTKPVKVPATDFHDGQGQLIKKERDQDAHLTCAMPPPITQLPSDSSEGSSLLLSHNESHKVNSPHTTAKKINCYVASSHIESCKTFSSDSPSTGSGRCKSFDPATNASFCKQQSNALTAPGSV